MRFRLLVKVFSEKSNFSGVYCPRQSTEYNLAVEIGKNSGIIFIIPWEMVYRVSFIPEPIVSGPEIIEDKIEQIEMFAGAQ